MTLLPHPSGIIFVVVRPIGIWVEEVLLWVIRGKDNRAIANRLNIHLSTVRKHLESIYRKLDVQSRTEAIAQALEKLGILRVQ